MLARFVDFTVIARLALGRALERDVLHDAWLPVLGVVLLWLLLPLLGTAQALAAPGDERIEEMRAAIFRLEEEYREPLVLQVLLGYSTREIAELMGMQQGAVLTRLFRARARLRQRLGIAAEPES